MNVHPDAVFTTVLYNNREGISFILACVSLYLEAVHLQIEDIKQDIQDSTSYYLFNTPTPNTNLLNITNDKTKYIQEFIQTCHSYSEPPTTPISKFSYTTTQYHITPDIRA